MRGATCPHPAAHTERIGVDSGRAVGSARVVPGIRAHRVEKAKYLGFWLAQS